MSNPMLFTKTISRKCKYLCAGTINIGHFNSSNVFMQKDNIIGFVCSNLNLNSFSSLSKFQEKTVLIKQNSKPPTHCYRTFSLKDSFESAIVTHSAIFKWITESTPVEYAKTFVVQFHDSSGLPWWMSIILTTCIARTLITFPLALYQNYVIAKLENVRKEMEDIVNDIKYDLNREIRRTKWPEKKVKRHFTVMVRKEWTRLVERDNCHPAKIVILAIFQIPTWIVFSSAFRNLVYKLPLCDTFAEVKCLELSVGGVAWFPNLLIADSFVLPITLGLVNLAIIEVQAMMHKEQKSRLQRYATNFFRGFAVFMIPVAATVPSCLALYWVTSSTFGLFQNLTLLSPRFRRLVGIPPTPTTVPHPYTHLAHQIRNKFSR